MENTAINLHETNPELETEAISTSPSPSSFAWDHILTGIPAAGLGANSKAGERIAKIFGLRVNQLPQLSKQIRDNQPVVFKRLAKLVKSAAAGENIPKISMDIRLVEEAMCRPAVRQQLIETYVSNVTAGRGGAGLPILELQLIKNWDPKFDLLSLKNAEDAYAFDYEHGASLVFGASFTAVHVLSIESHWLARCVARVSDHLVVAMCEWGEKGDAERALMAGACFAVSSLCKSSTLMYSYFLMAPDLFDYLDPEIFKGITKESWFSELPEQARDKGLKQLSGSVLGTVGALDVFRKTLLLEDLNKVRSKLDSHEAALLDLGAETAEGINKLRDEAEEILVGLVKAFAGAGKTLDCKPIEQRIEHWAALLQHDVMQEPSEARLKLTTALFEEARELLFDLDVIQQRFQDLSSSRQKAFDDGLTWEEQTKLMQDITDAVEELYQEFGEVSETAEEKPKLTVPETPAKESAPEPEPEVCTEGLIEELKRAHASHVEKLKLQLEDESSRNQKLRNENGEIRLQLDALKLSLGQQNTPVVAVPESVQGAIDILAGRATATEVLKLLEALYPDRIAVAKNGYDSAEEFEGSLPSAGLYQRLKALITTGLDLVRESGQIIDCNDVVQGGVAVNESETVRNSSRLRGLRTFSYNGARHTFYPHIKVDHSHRVYFDYFPDEKRFVVGYVGRHLPTGRNSTI